jgi:hypothetical protein
VAYHTEHTHRLRPATLLFAALLAAGLSLLSTAPALALGPPLVQSISFSHVTNTSATLEATISPNGVKTPVYHFQYTTLAQYKESGFAGAAETPDGPLIAAGAEPTSFSAEISGLQPATAYRFRVFAENSKTQKTESPAAAFATYALPLQGLPDGRAYEQASPLDKNGADITSSVSFAKAAADGQAVSFGGVSGLPGGEGAQAYPPLYLASRTGEGAGANWVTNGLLPSTGIAPVGQTLGWTPDFSRVYQKATRFGSSGLESALLERPGPGGQVTQITPLLPKADYSFAGASADASEAVFESNSAQLGTAPPGVEGRSNVYAWDADAKTLSLVSRMNSEEETEAALPAGAFAGPYDWATSNTGRGGAESLYYTHDTHAIAEDGSVFFTAAGSGHLYQRLNPTQEQSALDGADECTEPARACTIDVSGSSHRTAPDAGGPQPAAFQFASADGDTALFTSSEKLTDDANTGPEVPAPAIGRLTLDGAEEPEEELDDYFPGAHAIGVAAEGEHIYWVDPNQGTIARAKLNGSGIPTEPDESFIEPGETCFQTRPIKAPGVEQCAPSTPRYVAVHDGYVYWTNTGPLGGEGEEVPLRGSGTIGRAKINPATEEAEDIEPAFIRGEEVGPAVFVGPSDPQGIAVNSEHIYWANSLDTEAQNERFIARATLEGEDVDERFFETEPLNAFGLALSSTRLFYAAETVPFNGILSFPLEGGASDIVSLGQSLETRGVAVAGSHIYWSDQATGVIGRMRLPLNEPSDPSSLACSDIPRCEGEFIEPGGALLGLASDASGSHLYWSANGEVPPHLGNDLYRFQRGGTGGCEEAGGCLVDLAPLPPGAGEEDGAKVLGVVGASADAARVYFVANGVLTEAPNQAGEIATPGDCRGRFGVSSNSMMGRCNLYLWDGGDISFIAQLDPEGEGDTVDMTNWLPTIESQVMGTQKSAFVAADGRTLLFKSQQKLTTYDNEGTSELYLYRLGEGIVCVSCDPTGAPPGGPATLGTVQPSLLEAEDTTALASRNLATDGRRAFFESADPLVAADTNGSEGCPTVGSTKQRYPACRDVYEWEAPGEGSCEEGAPAYSPANGGCLYLISSGKGSYPSLFLDASESGSDVFFFTRSRLVGQDTDALLDVYDARVGGGIAAQSPPPPEACEGEACKPGASPPPGVASAATPGFQGTGNVREKPPRHCPRGKVRRHGKCVKKHKRHHHRKHNRPRPDNRGGRR